MSWKVHLTLSMLTAFGLFGLGLWCGSRLSDGKPIAMFALGVVFCLLGRFGFRAFVTALCPSCGEGTARQVGSRPIAYDCSSCGHRHETGIYEGNRRV